jgi:hypothetical protein
MKRNDMKYHALGVEVLMQNETRQKNAKLVAAGVDPATFPRNRNLIATRLSAEFYNITHTILLVIYKDFGVGHGPAWPPLSPPLPATLLVKVEQLFSFYLLLFQVFRMTG